MKINKLLSLDVDLCEKLKGEANASAVVNSLLEFHYSDNEESLQNKVMLAEQAFNQANAKLKLKVQQRQDKESRNREIKKLSKEEIERKARLDSWRQQHTEGKINTEEYFAKFDEKGIFKE